jgi:hypothetical protein
LIINDDLDKGTQIPYIEKALKEGYQVLVLNTNLNYWPDNGSMRSKPIPVYINSCCTVCLCVDAVRNANTQAENWTLLSMPLG